MSTLIASGGPLLFSNGPLEIRARKPRYVSLGLGSAVGLITQDRRQITNFVATPVSRRWYRIATDGNIFVAVTGDHPFASTPTPSNIAATSPDGITWTERTLPASALWSAITYGAGVFVAVARSTDNAAYSVDGGVTWLSTTMPWPGNHWWWAVTYGAGRFVALAERANGFLTGNAAISSDGINWTRTTITQRQWTGVTYGAGQFVAVATFNNVAATSPDGMAWTERTLPQNTLWSSVIYTGQQFLAVSTTANAATSTDGGVMWTQRTMPYSVSWQSLATDGQGNVMAVSLTNAIARSNDHGNTWTSVLMDIPLSYYSLAYGGDQA